MCRSSTHNGYISLQWWRTDNRFGKCAWVNVTNARVVYSIPSLSDSVGAAAKRRRSGAGFEDEPDSEVGDR